MRIAAVDMGSNSFHLVVVEAHPDGSFDTLLREKAMLRLGEVVTATGSIPETDVERVLDTMRRFAALAASIDAVEVVACATSALREADNSSAVVDAIRDETGIDVEVISGRREAELIFAAVRESVALEPAPAVCFDLGGGSLEVMVGDNATLQWSTSVHLGAARLATLFLASDPPTTDELAALSARVLEVLDPIAEEVATFEPKCMVGTSGTFLDLARMAAAVRTGAVPQSVNQLVVGIDELRQVHERLITTPAAGRAKVGGLDARRADQIPVGSQLLLTVMDRFGFDQLMVGEWALREGIVLDAIRRHEVAEWTNDAETVRRSSVLGLARRCNVDEVHAAQVARLALALFDALAGLHHLPTTDRELLEHAAFLHDIGEHVAVEGHHKHTAYLIEHGKLRGFDPEAVDVVATLGRYHRGSDPKSSFEPFGRLSSARRSEVLRLLAMLRLADGLDRGHAAAVDMVEADLSRADVVRLLVTPSDDVDLEVWGVRRKRDLFERVFERRLDVVAADHPSLAGGQ
ncbi:MAG TPA: Ppx/GppA phosphatase family protein [Acidimicrobiales bacterium]|nr:Ppx/GppA phosphatase family protein [Acidimicrobiales bacterium]